MPYPAPVEMTDRVDEATELLRTAELGVLWVQAVTDDGDLVTIHADVEDPELQMESMPSQSIEFIYGIPERLSTRYGVQCHLQLVGQHLFVAAHTVGLSFEACAEAAVNYAVQGGFVHEFPTELD